MKIWGRGQSNETSVQEMEGALPLLTGEGIRVVPRGETKSILDVPRFEIKPRAVHCLLGPNGSGKTTLLKVISRVWLDRAEATLRWHGQPAHRDSQLSWVRRVVYLGSDVQTQFPMSAWDYVWLGRRTAHASLMANPTGEDHEAIHWAMDTCSCWSLRAREVSSLSNGEKQRVLLARGLAQESKVLVLDETLTMLDLHQQQKLGERLKQWIDDKGGAIVLVAHDLNLSLRLGDEFSMMKEGSLVVNGRAMAGLSRDDLVKIYPDVELEPAKYRSQPRFLY